MNDEVKNPFPGLRPFEFTDNHLFFGRDEQTTELTTRLRKNRFVAVVGTSGSGKSSLVRAGLLPELLSGTMAGAGSSWETAIMRPGGDPLTNLANSIIEADLYDPDEEDIASQVRATLTRSGLGLVEAIRQSDLPEGTNFLLVVDQFEEIFRFRRSDDATDEQAAFFVNLLLEASSQSNLPLYIIITMRSDFLGECSQFPRLADTVNEGEFLIPRLNRDQRKEAILGPVKVAGGGITDRLLLRLLNDIGDDPDQLPILQHALMRTWDLFEEQGGKGDLDLEHYNATGGMTEALSRHADEVYNEQPDEEHKRIAQKLFKSLTEKVDANRGIRRPMALIELHEICGGEESHLRDVVDSFRKTGCTFLMPAGEREITIKSIIDISHESLMRVWRSLRNWVDEEAQSAKIYRRLADTASLYKEQKAGLYRDPDLQIAISWRDENRPNKTWADRYYPGFEGAMAFLDESYDESIREEREREEARQREVDQAKALAKARARSAAIFKFACLGVTILAITAVLAMIDARKSRDEADRQIINLAKRSIATGEALDAEDDHLGALVWYADAIRLAAKDHSIQSKYQEAFKTKLDNSVKLKYYLNIEEPIKHTSLLPGENEAIVITNYGNNNRYEKNYIYVINLSNGEKRTIFQTHGPIIGITFNNNDKCVAFVEQKTRTYHVVDIENEKTTFKRLSAFPNTRNPMFTGDGNFLIIGGSMENRDAGITVLDYINNKEVAKKKFRGILYNLHAVEENKVGLFFNEYTNNNKFLSVVWDWKNNSEKTLFDGSKEEGVINWNIVDKKRDIIVSRSEDFPKTWWNSTPSPKEASYVQVLENKSFSIIYSTPKKKNAISLYSLSPNGKYLALARNNGAIEVHDLDRFAMIWESDPEKIIGGGVQSLDFSPDGSMLLATGGSNNVGIWQSANGKQVTSDLKHSNILADSCWSKKGNAFLSASRKGEMRLYQIANPVGAKYLKNTIMTPDNTKNISEALSNRTIIDGRIVPLTNAPPALSSLPPIHQFSNKYSERNWHISRAGEASSRNSWAAVKFHLDKASIISTLDWFNLKTLFKANLNLGLYDEAEKALDKLEQDTNISRNEHGEYIPTIASKWKIDSWKYSGYYEVVNHDFGMDQEYLDQKSLELSEGKKWDTLQEHTPTFGSNIKPGEIYINAPVNSMYYVSKTFTVNEAGFYNIIFDSDDGMKAWINGNLVNVYSSFRGMFFAGDDRVQAWLRKGINIIVIKVVNGNGDTGFSFKIDGKSKINTEIERYYTRLAAGQDTEFTLSNLDKVSTENELNEHLQLASIFKSNKEDIDNLYDSFKKNLKFKEILEGSYLKPASYAKPSFLPTPEQLKNGFTLECFINTQKMGGVRHIVCNGGSFEESGFSLLTTGGNVRGEIQNTKTQEKTIIDVPFPFDKSWHHIALTYNAKTKKAIMYLDGTQASLPTSYGSPLVFNSQYLCIGDNEMRRMGYSGGITDVRVWNKPLDGGTIKKHANGQSIKDSDQLLVNLPLRFPNSQSAIKPSNITTFTSENITWDQSNVAHPMVNEEGWVFAKFENQNFGQAMAFANAGILEYRRNNFEKAFELLFRSFNNGRFLPEVKLRSGWGDQMAQVFLAMSYFKNERFDDYERFRNAINSDFNKFEIRTWELQGEKDVLERIKLKALQNEMNSLADR